MSRILLFSILASYTVLSLFSCDSIMEDRSACPCFVTLDFSGTDTSIKRLDLWFLASDGEILARDTILKESYLLPYNVRLAKDMVGCHVWGNPDTDSLYYSGTELDATGETVHEYIEVCREYADIYLILDGSEGDGILSSWITCSTSGRGIDGEYIEQEHIVSGIKEIDSDGNLFFRYRIIRQKSMEKMKLAVSTYSYEGSKVVNSYDLGGWLSAIGYDMEAENLEDVVIGADFSFSCFNIEVEAWNIKKSIVITI